MLRRPHPAGSGIRLCQACGLVSGRQWVQPAKRPFVALPPGVGLTAVVSRSNPLWLSARPFTTSQPCLVVKWPQSPQSLNASPSRFGRAQPSAYPLPDLVGSVAAVDRIIKAFMAHSGLPSEETTLKALRGCARIDVRQLVDVGERRSEDAAAEASPASQLLDLDGVVQKPGEKPAPETSPSLRPQDVVDKISDAAYAIVTHPNVVITRNVLEAYVRLQARLGRPQALPQVLALYASKPKPKLVAGTVRYVERNPNKAENAVDRAIADTALDAAIEAKDLEATIGILENTYAAKAFIRSKLINKALLPAATVAATPLALYLVATELAQLQYSLEPTTATNMAFVGVLCYVGFTASIGAVAFFTSNDQMKRVTWQLGTPLRHRWLYEDERAALDKIASSFGFSEEHRYGEEEGEDFMWLREYILQRSMVLDKVDLMPGMN
ncbi:hypothetical protein MFIFM68171_01291 [Madurella fahalii]|uniref:Uncharacterized protein n=1 Tax=Madurella fahalii TaxID=1157608 RepID=A0ABQ0FZZ0_9PEZI